MSIVPPEPDSNKTCPPTVVGVAGLMLNSADPFTREVGSLVRFIGEEHERPVTCGVCDAGDDPTPCPVLENATAVVISWLLKVVDERG